MNHPPQRDPAAMARASRRVQRLLVPYHRAKVHGLDRVPPGPALFVANHNGGFYTGDTYLFGAAVFRARGLAGTRCRSRNPAPGGPPFRAGRGGGPTGRRVPATCRPSEPGRRRAAAPEVAWVLRLRIGISSSGVMGCRTQQRLFRLLGLHPGPDIDEYAAAGAGRASARAHPQTCSRRYVTCTHSPRLPGADTGSTTSIASVEA
jgi:hypothetical protein